MIEFITTINIGKFGEQKIILVAGMPNVSLEKGIKRK